MVLPNTFCVLFRAIVLLLLSSCLVLRVFFVFSCRAFAGFLFFWLTPLLFGDGGFLAAESDVSEYQHTPFSQCTGLGTHHEVSGSRSTENWRLRSDESHEQIRATSLWLQRTLTVEFTTVILGILGGVELSSEGHRAMHRGGASGASLWSDSYSGTDSPSSDRGTDRAGRAHVPSETLSPRGRAHHGGNHWGCAVESRAANAPSTKSWMYPFPKVIPQERFFFSGWRNRVWIITHLKVWKRVKV